MFTITVKDESTGEVQEFEYEHCDWTEDQGYESLVAFGSDVIKSQRPSKTRRVVVRAWSGMRNYGDFNSNEVVFEA